MRSLELSGTAKRAVLAAGLGTMMDYYDFLLAANAAGTVWLTLYFKPAFKIPSLALSIAILTYAISYVVRPLGAFIFGHMGDRMGRQSTLVLTLLLAFISMVGMGATPTYAQIGVYSVILLMLFRLILGLSFGGEWGGGATWVSELLMANGVGELGYWGGVYQAFGTAGIALASLAFSLTSILMPTSAFYAWGWRMLFYIGAVVVVVAAIIRYRFIESPIFMELARGGKLLRQPAAAVLRREWGKVLLLALSWLYITAVTVVAIIPYSLVYVSEVRGIAYLAGLPSKSFMLLAYAASLLTGGVASTLLSGYLADRIDAGRILIIGSVATALMSIAFYPILSTGNPMLIMIGLEAYMLSEYFGFGSLTKFFTQAFPAEYRYSGSGLAYQFGGLMTGIASGFILSPVISAFGYSAWYLVSLLMVAISVTSLASSIALGRVVKHD
jgi:MFS family permease